MVELARTVAGAFSVFRYLADWSAGPKLSIRATLDLGSQLGLACVVTPPWWLGPEPFTGYRRLSRFT